MSTTSPPRPLERDKGSEYEISCGCRVRLGIAIGGVALGRQIIYSIPVRVGVVISYSHYGATSKSSCDVEYIYIYIYMSTTGALELAYASDSENPPMRMF